MIAINWFETQLPSLTLKIPSEAISDDSSIPRRIKRVGYRTVLDRKTSSVFHLTSSQPAGTTITEVNINQQRFVVTYAIEHGFASHLEHSSFQVRLKHVGGSAYRGIQGSIRPKIYESLEGLQFRCLCAFGERDLARWGLVLSFASSQRFAVSLQDSILKELALGKRVIPVIPDARNRGVEKEDFTIYSGILAGVRENVAVIVDQDGKEFEDDLENWTLPCNREHLLTFIRRAESAAGASEVSTRLQQDSLSLTAEGRINTNLAKNQLENLQTLLSKHALLVFPLLLPDQPSVRLSSEPLVVEK